MRPTPQSHRATRSSLAPRALIALLVLASTGCDASGWVEPNATARPAVRGSASAVFDPGTSVTTLLNSYEVGGTYTLLPRGGYGGSLTYTQSPERERYAGSVNRHPTGIDLPVGLPVRILLEGAILSTPTPAFFSTYCSASSGDNLCEATSTTYSVAGLQPGPGIMFPYSEGSGLNVSFGRVVPFAELRYAVFPSQEAFAGRVPASGDTTLREIHVRRSGCCYNAPSSTQPAMETYEGSWRVGVVPDDGGRPELGIDPTVWIVGARTDAAASAPSEFSIESAGPLEESSIRWWFIRPAHNVFDGIPVNLASPSTLPRYPVSSRSQVIALVQCAGQSTCEYQAPAGGAMVAQVTTASGATLAARNTGYEPAAVVASLKCAADGAEAGAGETLAVLRGAELRCEVSDLGTSVVSDWQFTSADGTYSVSRAEGTEGMDTAQTQWVGPVALPGVVTALLQTETEEPQELSITIAITGRAWAGTRPYGYPSPRLVNMQSEEFALGSPPVTVEDLGAVRSYAASESRLVLSDIVTPNAGPNAGLSFFARVPNFITRIDVLLNTEALREHSAFWKMQVQTKPAYSSAEPCIKRGVLSALTRQRILDHEGDQFQLGSHTQRYRAEYERIVGPRMESLVLRAAAFADAYATVVIDLKSELDRASAIADRDNKLSLGCDFTFN